MDTLESFTEHLRRIWQDADSLEEFSWKIERGALCSMFAFAPQMEFFLVWEEPFVPEELSITVTIYEEGFNFSPEQEEEGALGQISFEGNGETFVNSFFDDPRFDAHLDLVWDELRRSAFLSGCDVQRSSHEELEWTLWLQEKTEILTADGAIIGGVTAGVSP